MTKVCVQRRLFLAIGLLCGLSTTAAPAAARTAYALTPSNQLVTFDTETPGTIISTQAIQGLLSPFDIIVGIDIRPATGQLYGLARRAGDGFLLYRIDPLTAQATAVNPTYLDKPFSVANDIDFNPTTDRIRFVNNTGVNFRLTPDEGELAADDTPLNPASQISDIAHTANYNGALYTTVYGIDFATDHLVMIGGKNGSPSPDDGVVTDVGPLGVNISNYSAIDIVSVGGLDTAYAILDAGPSSLYKVNLNTGHATLVGQIGAGSSLLGLAVATPVSVPVYAITAQNTLIAFNSLDPEKVFSSVGIGGLQVGESILGLDVRPATGQLYALGSTGRLYTIDPSSGYAVAVSSTLPFALNGSDFGLDFNPVVDRLRVVSTGEQNFRLHPDTGAVVSVDVPLAPPGAIGAAAYTNNRPGALMTTLYGIDMASSSLVRIGGVNGTPSPNSGGVTTIGPIGLTVQDMTGFDIASADGTAYASITTGGVSRFYTINLATGAGTPAGFPADGTALRALAVSMPGVVEISSPEHLVSEGGLAIIRIRRSGGIGPLTVDVKATAGSATSGADYEALLPHQITFYNGSEEGTIIIPILDDALVESDETFTVSISNPGMGARLGAQTSTTVTILDMDNAPNKPGVTITSPTADTSYPATTPFLTLAGTASDNTGIASVTWYTDQGASGTATGTTAWTAANIPLAAGESTNIWIKATDLEGNSSYDGLWVPAQSGIVYTLAEGATGGFFDLDLLLANPHEKPAPVTLDFLKEDGSTITQLRVLPPLSRTTVRVDNIPGLEFGAVSTIVTSNDSLPLVVERTMSWDASGYGAHGEHATAGPALKWYFAEGSQGFFDTFLLLTNPGGGANTAHVSFLLENGGMVNQSFPMLGSSRLSVPLKTIDGLATQSFGIVVTFDAPGVAERAMYFGSPLYNGGHSSAGENELSTDWFLAEGASSSFFTTFVLLANPGNSDADVTLTYLPEGGAPVVKQRTVAAGKRVTINAGYEAPSLTSAAFATRVQSTQPIVVERAQYWPNGPDQWYEAHNSFGVTALGTHWGLAEGRIGGDAKAQTFILLANPGDTDAQVTVRFLREPGKSPQVVTRTVTVKAGSRLTLGPAEQKPDLVNETFGASITSTQPIAVERALYWDANGQFWAAGTNATATRLP